MGYSSSPLEELCDILMRDIRRRNEQLESAQAVITPSDMEYIEMTTRAILNIKKTLHIMEESDSMRSYGSHHMPTWSAVGYGDMRHMEPDHTYGGRARDSRGRYMDDDMMGTLRDIMNRTPDERTREDLRRMLDNR